MAVANDLAVRRALEAAGVIFIGENGDAGPGVRCQGGDMPLVDRRALSHHH